MLSDHYSLSNRSVKTPLKSGGYKLRERGGQLIKVDPKYTSQTCNDCGHISKENRRSQSNFVSDSCGYSENADVVGAKNILVRGLHDNKASLKIAV